MTGRPDIGIIGPGVVGTTLGVLAARAGYRIAGLAGRTESKTRRAAGRIGEGVGTGSPAEIAGAAGLVLLTVPDDAIEPVCKALAEGGCFQAGAVVAHCSGALASEILAPARELCGAVIASMHPLQTFPNVDAGIKRVGGTYFFCEGDDPAVAALTALAEAIGGKAVRMASAGKLLYHAAAVMACNYLTALMDAALATAGHADIGGAEAMAALEPLVRATLDNIMATNPPAALTGPIARGDAGLVARQVRDVAAADSRLGDIYRTLGTWTIGVALRKGTIDEAKASKLREALSQQ